MVIVDNFFCKDSLALDLFVAELQFKLAYLEILVSMYVVDLSSMGINFDKNARYI